MTQNVLIDDTRNTVAISTASRTFSVKQGEVAVIRGTKLDGSAQITLYWYGPDGSFEQAVQDDGTVVRLTPSEKEKMINIPGVYGVSVDVGATTKGAVFYSK